MLMELIASCNTLSIKLFNLFDQLLDLLNFATTHNNTSSIAIANCSILDTITVTLLL